MSSLMFHCTICKEHFSNGWGLRNHMTLKHGARYLVPPSRQVNQRIEGGRDHAAARPAVPDDPNSATADAVADSGFPDYDHGSEGDD